MVSEAVIEFALISLAGLAYATYAILATNILGNRPRVNQIQGEIKTINEKVKNLSNSKDKKSEEELAKLQEKLPNLLFESMVLQFKPLIATLPALLILPPFIRSIFPDFTITLSFYLPIFIQHLERFPNWRNFFGTNGWFWLAFLFSSITIQLTLTAIKKLKKGEQNATSKT